MVTKKLLHGAWKKGLDFRAVSVLVFRKGRKRIDKSLHLGHKVIIRLEAKVLVPVKAKR